MCTFNHWLCYTSFLGTIIRLKVILIKFKFKKLTVETKQFADLSSFIPCSRNLYLYLNLDKQIDC